MKSVFLYFVMFFLIGCGEINKEPNNTHENEINAKNEISKWFENYHPIMTSEIITTRYILYVYTLNNKYNSDINKKIISEWERSDWRAVKDEDGKKFFCDNNGNIIETVEPLSINNKKLNGIVATQLDDIWQIGYSYRTGGNDECKK
ncbi:hypothetical protein [Acinetobacter sp.]|jgi:hypothetical protein|uniref:hypothetical protein n=1 Tax=Acinetobacter sp. TaxID=472 RepID=UPI00282D86E6|nr:hypothetical protein [Acinetobacter sp.]MDR0235369.1 hypothetical protein [Acinetobacter sp.]